MKYPFLFYLFNVMCNIGAFLTGLLLLLLLADWILDWPLFDMAEDIIGGWIWVGVPLYVVGGIGSFVIATINTMND